MLRLAPRTSDWSGDGLCVHAGVRRSDRDPEDGDGSHGEGDRGEARHRCPVLGPAGEDPGDDGLEDEVGGEDSRGQGHGFGDVDAPRCNTAAIEPPLRHTCVPANKCPYCR